MPSILLLAPASATAAATGPADIHQAPAEHCLDTRQVDSVYHPNDTQLLVASGSRHFRLTLSSACPGLIQADGLSLRAPQGFVCGSGQVTVVAGNQRYPVVAIQTIDSRSQALGARQSWAPCATASSTNTPRR